MPLNPGTTLGVYEVLAKIGEGGMGEVYQARDTTLERDVALKVLPEAFTADAERLARFEREAKVLASLNHPNIGGIYGFESTGDTRALVLELIEGPTLADRIAQGPISLAETLPIARQIGEALEAAHEQGVIHRDLKPANIKVKADGTVKVLDFGLAKAFQPAGAESNLSVSPTISLTVAATQLGMVLGTAAYMAPEQAKGRAVDKRVDVWAFGAVLYEMLAGARVFAAADVSDTLAYVLTKDIDWEPLPTNTPASLRRLLRRCLERDPKRRLRDIGDARLELDELLAAPLSEPSNMAAVASPRLRPWQRPLPAVVALALIAVVAWLAGSTLVREPVSSGGVVRVAMALPESAPLGEVGRGAGVAMSPDGTSVVYRGPSGGSRSGESVLYLRAVDELEVTPLVGTANGGNPFYSPDGEWIGFTVMPGGRVSKVSTFGGAAEVVATLPGGVRGAVWGVDNQIIIGQLSGGLQQVEAAGGATSPLTTPDVDRGEVAHHWPALIPDRRAVLFAATTTSAAAGSQLAVLELDTGTVTRLGLAGTRPRYVRTGHVLYTPPTTVCCGPCRSTPTG
jgi:hypothetical protein